MPFTAYHMGPACVIKAALGRHFSLMVFGFAQVLEDIEPLVRLFRGDPIKHGLSHSYFGATIIGIVAVLIGRPLCQLVFRVWKPDASVKPLSFMNWLRGSGTISWPAAITGAFVGSFSHIAVDSVVNGDMQPYAPFASGNHLLGAVSWYDWHLFCLASGLVGCGLLIVSYFLTRSKTQNEDRSN